MLVGKSVGLRASDFLGFTYGNFRCLKLENEAPLDLGEIRTQKESVPAYPFLDSDAVPIVKAWLDSHKDAKDNDRILDDTEDNLSVILQTLCKKAGVEIDDHGTIHGKRVRFHCMRKFLIDRLSATSSESQWKQMVGKTIDEGAYVSQDQLRGIFTRAMKDLLINGNGKTKKLIELENALIESQRRLTSVETANETLQNRMEKYETTLTSLGVDVNTIKKFAANIEQKQIEQDKRIVVLEETERKKPEKVRID